MNELTMDLKQNSGVPLYEQIYEYIKEDIRDEHLICGAKLPSTRALAKHLGVSRSTVELAYEQLLSEGYIESEPCKGFFVAEINELYQLKKSVVIPQKKVIRPAKKYRYDFSPRGIDLHSFPYGVWRKLSKEILMDDRSELFKIGNPKGEEGLRNAIRDYLHQARGVNCDVEQIVVGAGSDYLMMLLGMLVGDGYRIAFENPTYKQLYQLFENLSYEVTTVDMDQYGMSVEKLYESGANMAYVMPSHQYPLGTVMPMKRRLELLKWASEEEGRYIVEDDYDSEFRYKGKPIPALQGYDSNGTVIYLGTFSKSIAPAIRISYLVLPKPLIEIYETKCRFLNPTVAKVDQYVVQRFMEDGYYERHLNKMRALYKNRHDILMNSLKPLLTTCTISGEHAGVHLLLNFEDERSEVELLRLAEQKQIKVYGLSEYDTDKSPKDKATILLGFANMKEQDIVEATKILCEIWK